MFTRKLVPRPASRQRRTHARLGFAFGPLILICYLLSGGRHAAAQSGDKAGAEALFNQGRQLEAAGKFAEACAKFEASQQLEAGLGTLLFLADCYEKAGLNASAWATFREAAALAQSRGETERVKIANVRATALEPELLQLQLEAVPPVAPGFVVTRNGVAVPAAALGTAVPVDAGTWLVRATAPGFEPFEAKVTLRQDDPKQPYVLRIGPLVESPNAATAPANAEPAVTQKAAPAKAPPQVPAPSEANGQRTIAWIIGGAGAIAALSSIALTVLAATENSSSLGNCKSEDPGSCSPRGKSERDDAQAHADIATVAGIVGAIALGAGATLYFTAPEPDQVGATVNLRGTW